MTPKDKAIELKKKCFSVDFEDGQEKYFANLIADEVITVLSDPELYQKAVTELNDINYWNLVKEEINKE